MTTILANSASLGYNASSSGSYTPIAVKSITSQKPEWAVVDVSGLADATAIKLPGFVDNKEFSWEMFHTTANKALLATLGGLVFYYQITLSDSSTFSFQAILKSYSTKFERNGSVVYNCQAEITGPVT